MPELRAPGYLEPRYIAVGSDNWVLPPVLPPSCVTGLGPGNTGPPVSTSTSCRVTASMPTRRSSKLVWFKVGGLKPEFNVRSMVNH
jgi:hypothetical protein